MSVPRIGLYRSVLATLLGLVAGCVVTVEPDPDDGDGGPNEGEILVRLVNATNVTLDPEIYFTDQAVSADQLFDASNKFTAFGVGTLGLLGDFDQAQFSVACSDARLIGTSGGLFGNNLNAPDGSGRAIVLTQELNIFCGGTLTLTYSRAGDGFTTTFDVEP